MAGLLQDCNVPTRAITLGRSSDIENLCSCPVAKSIKCEHLIYGIPEVQAQKLVDFSVGWEHIAASINSITTHWGFLNEVPALPNYFASGLLMERIICGLYSSSIRMTRENASFEIALRNINKNGGIAEQNILSILPNAGPALEHVKVQMNQRYQSGSDLETLKIWLFLLNNKVRMWQGMYLWRMSFTSWPRLPVFSQALMALSAQLPLSTTDQRRAQKALVVEKYPHLAQLPLDRNLFDTTPLSPGPWRQRLSALYRAQSISWKVQKELGRERRYYYRIYNVNSPSIRAIRQQANRYRDSLADVFDMDAFNKLLPSEDQIPLGQNPILETKRYLLMLGILLWAGKYL